MKSVLALAALGAAAAQTTEQVAQWNAWKAANTKSYALGAAEETKRMEVFFSNAEYVAKYNAEHTTHQLSLNKFADLTNEEFKAQYTGLGKSRPAPPPVSHRYANTVAAPTVDWRGTAVTPVKDQGQCGSCWAFSATGTIEGAWYLATGDLVSVSEQELVDCDVVGDGGCNGGLMDNAMNYIIANGGICAEADYPYTAKDGQCVKDQCSSVVTLVSHESVPSSDEEALKQAVTMRPVAVAAQADELNFQLYSGGVFDAACGTQLDHGMLAVGYGFDDASGLEYWIIKNSWGGSWGDNGYIMMAFGKNNGDCQCGICLEPSYGVSDGTPAGPAPPAVAKPPPPPGGSFVACDAEESALCPVGETCCCTLASGSSCLEFGCCPYPDAVCCSDYESCCPAGYTCDVAAQSCALSAVESMPMLKRHPAIHNAAKVAMKVPAFINAVRA